MKVKFMLIFAIILLGFGLMWADGDSQSPPTTNSAIGGLTTAARSLCTDAQSLLRVGIILMIVLGAATYAIGQVMSSEIRGRAVVWATSMFMAALFAAIIYMLVPWIIATMWGGVNKGGTLDCNTLSGVNPNLATSTS